MRGLKTTNEDLLVSLIENNTIVYNMSNSLSSSDKNLIMHEHFEVIDNNLSVFTEGFEKTFVKIIKKIGDLIHTFINWVKEKLSVFIRKLKKERIRMNASDINRSSNIITKAPIDIELTTSNLLGFYNEFNLELRTINTKLFSVVGFRSINMDEKSDDISKDLNKLSKKFLEKVVKIKVERTIHYNVSKADKLIDCFNNISDLLTDKYERDVKKQISTTKEYHDNLKRIFNSRQKVDSKLYNTASSLGVYLQSIISVNSSLLTITSTVLSETERVLNTFSN
jgi:hypothetical protein